MERRSKRSNVVARDQRTRTGRGCSRRRHCGRPSRIDHTLRATVRLDINGGLGNFDVGEPPDRLPRPRRRRSASSSARRSHVRKSSRDDRSDDSPTFESSHLERRAVAVRSRRPTRLQVVALVEILREAASGSVPMSCSLPGIVLAHRPVACRNNGNSGYGFRVCAFVAPLPKVEPGGCRRPGWCRNGCRRLFAGNVPKTESTRRNSISRA
jgi:hypothetical protein